MSTDERLERVLKIIMENGVHRNSSNEIKAAAYSSLFYQISKFIVECSVEDEGGIIINEEI